MLYAKQGDAVIAATPGAIANCPSCGDGVVAKCGKILIWHWAHRAADCDPWSEPMSQWHVRWQSLADAAHREVVMSRDGQHHRADVVVRNGAVLELQSSPITADDIAARESFYGRMAWLYRASEWKDRLHFGRYGFWWKHGAVTQTKITKPLFWDVGDEVWQVSLSRAVEHIDVACNPTTNDFDHGVRRETNRVLGKVLRRWNPESFARATFGRTFAEAV